MQRALRSWRKDLEKAESAIADAVDTFTFQDIRKNLVASFDMLTDEHEKLFGYTDRNHSPAITQDYEVWYEQNRETLKIINNQIAVIPSEASSIRSKRSKVSRSSSYSSTSKKAEMLSKTFRIGTELNFSEIEKEKASELKKVRLIKELAANQAEIEAITKLEEESDR